jgi:nucleoid DNA-binding protein
MVLEISQQYHSIKEDDVRDIIKSFCKYCKEEMLKGNSVEIKNIGTFGNKDKSALMTSDCYGKKRLKPKMNIPFFKTARKMRNFINKEPKNV